MALARLRNRWWKRILVTCLRAVLLGITPFARLVLQCYPVLGISLPFGHPRFLGDRSVVWPALLYYWLIGDAQVLLGSWLPTGQYGSCTLRLGSTKIMDTIILDASLILRRRL